MCVSCKFLASLLSDVALNPVCPEVISCTTKRCRCWGSRTLGKMLIVFVRLLRGPGLNSSCLSSVYASASQASHSCVYLIFIIAPSWLEIIFVRGRRAALVSYAPTVTLVRPKESRRKC